MQIRTVAVLLAAGALALSAGFATNYLLHDRSLALSGTSEEADLESLFAARMPDLSGTERSLAQWRGTRRQFLGNLVCPLPGGNPGFHQIAIGIWAKRRAIYRHRR